VTTVLSHDEARRTYDRIGSLQDSQGFYEDRAVERLLAHCELDAARSVFELGCGTGRLADRLLAERLPPEARYRGIDLSPHMVSLARARLAPHGDRAEVVESDGEPPRAEPTAAFDRFLAAYVFDLLSEEDIRGMLAEAHRMLVPGGLLGVTGLSTGVGPVSRTVERAWRWLQERHPAWVGGCRPIDVRPLLPEDAWTLVHHEKVVAFGVTSEVLVARRAGPAAQPA
jgi:ubiquinone/menaquinone biosynthesis C-methylase UbiE